ncbi:hypothetical protein [Flagellimonas sp. CMM7]|uniref:hypothetical protein n=1 Tax=Flagellimonas sp. CMM7 TaxID=2654676 RepID=UPI0013D44358|nr:hypothetical protein [Flagellimonas sp. CMM7]UII81066.1 hypothetical protein LV704_06010 [Flagellimonas sp. CMM7]
MEKHIVELETYRKKYSILLEQYNRKNPPKALKQDMENIRYYVQNYMRANNLFEYLIFGGSTPQQQAEYNDFDSISDFDEIIEGVILKLKSK